MIKIIKKKIGIKIININKIIFLKYKYKLI